MFNNVTYHFHDKFYQLATLCEGVQQDANENSLQFDTVEVNAKANPSQPTDIAPADKTAVENPYKKMKFPSLQKSYDLDCDEDVDALLNDIEASPDLKIAFIQRMNELSEKSRKGDKDAKETLIHINNAMNKIDPHGFRAKGREGIIPGYTNEVPAFRAEDVDGTHPADRNSAYEGFLGHIRGKYPH